MKIAPLVFLVLLLIAAPFAHAAFYQWTDTRGVIHLTDDPRKIPKRYQKSARKLQLSEEPAAARGAAPVPQPPRQVSRPRQPAPGGHPERWWRERFATLRGELQALEAALPEKEEKLVQLRRERAIFQRTRDRVAVNAMKDEVSAHRERISELRAQIDALEQAAARAEVPVEWRR